jgi:tyrosyl-tRNA synthetase
MFVCLSQFFTIVFFLLLLFPRQIYKALGVTALPGVNVCLASEQINARASEYWLLVMDIARRFDIKRVLGCGSAMGVVAADASASASAAAPASDEKQLEAAAAVAPAADADVAAAGSDLDGVGGGRVLYPCMQCADPFFLRAHVCHVAAARRPVVEVSRDYCEIPEVRQAARGAALTRPVMLVQPSLMSLRGAHDDRAFDNECVLFMDDEAADVKKKINRAFCPEKECAGNPCIELAETLVFALGAALEVKRTEANGGDKYAIDA